MVIKTIQSMSKNTFGGINGFQKNKIGSVVGYKFRGEQVYRGYQKNVANPRTSKQVNARKDFGETSSLMRLFSRAIVDGLTKAAAGTMLSPRNLAMRLNKDVVTVNPASGISNVDYTKVVLAKGNLLAPTFGRIDLSTPQTIIIPVTDTPYQLPADMRQFYGMEFVVICPTLKRVLRSSKGLNDINNGNVDVEIPSSFNGLEVSVYGFARWNGEDVPEYVIGKGDVSDSQYLGTGEVG